MTFSAAQRKPVTLVPPAVGSLAQNPYLTTYAGAVVTTTDPAGQQSRRYADALGRLVRVDERGLLGGAAAAGTVTMTGAEQSVPSNSVGNGATAGTASISFAATAACSSTIPDRCNTQVVQQAAPPASVTVTISGKNRTDKNCVDTQFGTRCTSFADSGNLNASLNIVGTVLNPPAVGYGSASTTLSLAQGPATNLSGNPVVRGSSGPAPNADASPSSTLTTSPPPTPPT